MTVGRILCKKKNGFRGKKRTDLLGENEAIFGAVFCEKSGVKNGRFLVRFFVKNGGEKWGDSWGGFF